MDAKIEQKSTDTVDDYLEFINTIHSKLEKNLQEDKENNYKDLRSLITAMGKSATSKGIETPYNTPTNTREFSIASVLGFALTDRQKAYLKGLKFWIRKFLQPNLNSVRLIESVMLQNLIQSLLFMQYYMGLV